MQYKALLLINTKGFTLERTGAWSDAVSQLACYGFFQTLLPLLLDDAQVCWTRSPFGYAPHQGFLCHSMPCVAHTILKSVLRASRQ